MYQATSDSSAPSAYATISYYTAPSSLAFGAGDVSATISLTDYSQYIWVQRDSTAMVAAMISNQTSESNTQRWASPAATWNVSAAFDIPYVRSYHQYLMNFNYSVVPATTTTLVGPSVDYTSAGTNQTVIAPAQVWADAGSTYFFSNAIGSSTSTERWAPLGGSVSGTVTGNATVSKVFYNQFLVDVSYSVVGTRGNVTPPVFTGISFGESLNVPLNSTVGPLWLDSGSSYSVPGLLPGSNSTDQWISTQKNLTGTVGMTTALDFTYYHQYALNFSYTIVGGGSPQFLPIVNYSSTNGTLSTRLSPTPSPVWVNAGSALNVSSVMAASNSSERWAYNSGSELASAPGTFEITLSHQFQVGFLIEVIGGGFSEYATLGQGILLRTACPDRNLQCDNFQRDNLYLAGCRILL